MKKRNRGPAKRRNSGKSECDETSPPVRSTTSEVIEHAQEGSSPEHGGRESGDASAASADRGFRTSFSDFIRYADAESASRFYRWCASQKNPEKDATLESVWKIYRWTLEGREAEERIARRKAENGAA